MANRNWRSGGYNSYNQLLQPVSYFAQPISYDNRKPFGGKPNYHDDKRNRKDFQSGRRDRNSPIKRRSSPYQRSHDSHGSFRKDVRKSHGGGRHEAKAPRMTLDVKELSTYSLKQRYSRMYTPSDFFHTNLKWQEVFPLYRPMRLGNNCDFQILNKEVEIEGFEVNNATVDPEDADSKYSAKVMLLSSTNLTDLYKTTTKLRDTKGSKNTLNKCIQFLVGTKGKNEPMAIGGSWSPSLDGTEPESDSCVLINTAIRTCKALTGIDLSKCKKWFKFMEINYYRPGDRNDETDKKDDLELKEDKVETVVIFIPDIWSCIPTNEEWTEIKKKFSDKLSSLIQDDKEVKMETEEMKDEVKEPMDISMKSEESETEKTEAKETITISNLNLYKVPELRVMCTERGLDSKGLKNALIARLTEALEAEKEENDKPEENKEVIENSVTEPPVAEVENTEKIENPVVTEEVEKKVILTDKEKQHFTKMYTLPENPCILIRPNYLAKDNKFDCFTQSLDSLLDYRSDDQKEHIFEMSLFAEQFNEMLQRDALFYIYRSLLNMPDLAPDHGDEPELKKIKIEVDKRKTKMTPDMHLLFSFTVFDPDNVGYIRDHVLEYLIHNLGLNLSRSQVKKLINKIPNRKGSLMYKEVATREIVEGSVDDIAMLKLQIEKVQKLAELAQGNSAFFEDGEPENVTRTGNLDLLDKLEESEFKKMNCELQLSILSDEIERLKNIKNESGAVVTDLGDNILKTKEKLDLERDNLSKLNETNSIYYNLLKSARDTMDISVKSISDQYEKEKQAKEAEKQALLDAAAKVEESKEKVEESV